MKRHILKSIVLFGALQVANTFATEPKADLCLNIPKMHCDGCVDKVSEGLEGVKGVKSVKVDLPTKTAFLVTGKDFAGLTAAKSAVADTGYEEVNKVDCK